MAKTVQMIFKVKNDRGELLIEVAARQGEIWTARAKRPKNNKGKRLEEGDRVLLKRSWSGETEYEGVIRYVGWSGGFICKQWEIYTYFPEENGASGFFSAREWMQEYRRLNPRAEEDDIIYFIHITNIKPYVKPPRKRGRSKR